MRTRHRAVQILIEQEPSFKPNLKFKTRNADWEKCKQFLQAPLVNYSTNFPLARNFRKIIDKQANNKLTVLIVGSALSFFGLTEISNKRAKDWWNNNIKVARKEMKESMRRYKIRQSPANFKKNGRSQEKIPKNCHF